MKDKITKKAVKTERGIKVITQKPVPPRPEPEEKEYTNDDISAREYEIEVSIVNLNRDISALQEELSFLQGLKKQIVELEIGAEITITEEIKPEK